MTIKEALEYRNSQQSSRTFKVSKNWVMVKSNNDQKFKDWGSFEKFIDSVKEEINTNNSRINSFKTIEFAESLGLEVYYKSVYGSVYFLTEKGKIRISNHDWTSEKHIEPVLNLCSYNKEGYKEMISELANFLK